MKPERSVSEKKGTRIPCRIVDKKGNKKITGRNRKLLSKTFERFWCFISFSRYELVKAGYSWKVKITFSLYSSDPWRFEIAYRALNQSCYWLIDGILARAHLAYIKTERTNESWLVCYVIKLLMVLYVLSCHPGPEYLRGYRAFGEGDRANGKKKREKRRRSNRDDIQSFSGIRILSRY